MSKKNFNDDDSNLKQESDSSKNNLSKFNKNKSSKKNDKKNVISEDELNKIYNNNNVIKHNVSAKSKNSRFAARKSEKYDDTNTIIKHLSKKNTDYLFKLRKGLAKTSLDKDKQKEILEDMLPNIIEAQRNGRTASSIYGPINEYINKLVNAPVNPKPTPFWLMTTNMSCLFLTMFAGIYGIFGLISPKMAKESTNGWITLILISLVAGLLMAYSNKWVGHQKKGSVLKIILVSILAILSIMVILSLVMMIPRKINFVISPVPELILAVIAYCIHFFLKKHFKPLGYFRE